MTRPLELHEREAFDAVVDVAGVAVRSDKAWMEIAWQDRRLGPPFPELVLRPANPASCPVTVRADLNRIELHTGPVAWDVNGRKHEERLALLRDCVEALVKGRFQLALELPPKRFKRLPQIRGWSLIGVFETPAGPKEFVHAPVEYERYAELFRANGAIPEPDAKGRIGPRRFAGYWEPAS